MDQVVIFREHATVEITAKQIGEKLAKGCADEQAEILMQWSNQVDSLSRHGGSWCMQCRMIAEEMSDEGCSFVLSMLESLTDHLRAIPRERAERPPEPAPHVDAFE